MKIDFTNKRFGNIVCVKPLRVNNHTEVVWLFKCDCSKLCEKSSCAFKNISKIASCGCMKGKKPHMTNLELKNYKPIHECYVNMKTRCYNPNYELYSRYGGRGIKVCDEWKDNFKEFYNWAINGWKKGLTLDRINNDDDYKPDNCRWVDRVEQANNRHTNYLIKYKGEIKTMAQWSKILKIDYSFIQIRMYKNKTMEEVVEEWNLKSKTYFAIQGNKKTNTF